MFNFPETYLWVNRKRLTYNSSIAFVLQLQRFQMLKIVARSRTLFILALKFEIKIPHKYTKIKRNI